MKDNIYNACKAHNCLEWFREQRACPAKWKKMKQWYVKNCPPKEVSGQQKLGFFKVLQFQTQVRAEQQQLRDGVREMMHIVAFQHHAKKAKNYPPMGLDADAAKAEFKRLSEEEDAIFDYHGPAEPFRLRVGILVKTLLIDRNMLAKSQGHTLSEKAVKNTTQAQVDQSYLRLHTSL
jgi:hypothetical protein